VANIHPPVEWARLTDAALRDVRDDYEIRSITTGPGRLRLHCARVARAATLELDRRHVEASAPWVVYSYDLVGPFGHAVITRRTDDSWTLTWDERVEWFPSQESAEFAAERWLQHGVEPSRAPTLTGLPPICLEKGAA
jgi:hypothetical protein